MRAKLLLNSTFLLLSAILVHTLLFKMHFKCNGHFLCKNLSTNCTFGAKWTFSAGCSFIIDGLSGS